MQQDGNASFKEIFLYNFYQSLLKKAFLEFPILESFERVTFEATIREFKRLDRELFNLNQKRIAYDAMSYPNVDYGAYLGGSAKDRRERGLIEAEIKKTKTTYYSERFDKKSTQIIAIPQAYFYDESPICCSVSRS